MDSFIEINRIRAGWLTLGIEDNLFEISYLTDVKDEFDYLLDLETGSENSKSIILEMETDGALCIHAIRDYSVLYLTLFEMYNDVIRPVTYRFQYSAFIAKYLEQIESKKQDYIDEFLLLDEDDEPYLWESENYKKLRGKLLKEE